MSLPSILRSLPVACILLVPCLANAMEPHVAALPASPLSQLPPRGVPSCARPFQRSGTVELKPGFSGSVGEFVTPGGGMLAVRSIRTTLRVAGLRASAIATYRNGSMQWHPLRMESGAGVYSSSSDVPVHADAGSLLKIEIDRSGSTAATAIGDYRLEGCLIDRMPPVLKKPVNVPRLPPKVPTPLEPVEHPEVLKSHAGS